jgi:hypothetical protein
MKMTTNDRAGPAGSGRSRATRLRIRLPMLTGVLAISAGTALGWDWLAAAGLAPFLLGALPCAAACALGLCIGTKPAESTPTVQESGK